MKSIKYGLLTLIAIAVSGLIWLSKSSPVVSQATVLLKTEPPLEDVIADETVVKFKLQTITSNKQPLSDANIQVRIFTPGKTPWLASDFPIVEGTELLNFEALANQGTVEFEQVLPIRGNYLLETSVTPRDAGVVVAFEDSLNFKVPENTVKYRNLAILAAILLLVGFGSGWILAVDQTVREDEIAPQPVRMLLSGMDIVAMSRRLRYAIAILLLLKMHLVNLRLCKYLSP